MLQNLLCPTSLGVIFHVLKCCYKLLWFMWLVILRHLEITLAFVALFGVSDFESRVCASAEVSHYCTIVSLWSFLFTFYLSHLLVKSAIMAITPVFFPNFSAYAPIVFGADLWSVGLWNLFTLLFAKLRSSSAAMYETSTYKSSSCAAFRQLSWKCFVTQ